jgi:hypothetical protein
MSSIQQQRHQKAVSKLQRGRRHPLFIARPVRGILRPVQPRAVGAPKKRPLKLAEVRRIFRVPLPPKKTPIRVKIVYCRIQLEKYNRLLEALAQD